MAVAPNELNANQIPGSPPIIADNSSDEFDEAFEWAGGFIGRKGRFLLMKNERTEEEHKALIKRLAASRDELAATVDQKVLELTALLRRFHPFELLVHVAFRNAIHNVETYAEYKHDGRVAFVEYASLLYYCQPASELNWESTDVVDGPVIEEVQSKIEELFHLTMWQFATGWITKPDEVTEPSALDELKFNTLTHSLIVRYPAYGHHLQELLEELFKPIEEVLRKSVGFAASDAIKLYNAIAEEISTRLISRRRLALHTETALTKAVEKYRKRKVFTKGVPREMILELAKMTPRESKRGLQNFSAAMTFVGMHEIATFTVDELIQLTGLSADIVRPMLAALTLSPGQVEERYRSPAPTHPLSSKAFLRDGDSYFCPLPQSIPSVIRPAIEELLIPGAVPSSTLNHAWERYENRRSQYVENKAVDYLKQALPSATFHQSLKYPIPGKLPGTVEEAELDALGFFDSLLLLVECKAGTVSLPARRGAPKRMVKELQELVGHPYEQASRAREYISNNPNATFRAPDGTEILVQRDRIESIILITVSLESLDCFTPALYRLREVGLLGQGDYPWAISLTDLRVICELVEFPAQLRHFLSRRARVNEHAMVMAMDELDLFGCYLHEGLYHDDFKNQKVNRLQLLSYIGPMDDYYHFITGLRQTPAEKPRMNLPKELRQIITMLEEHRPHGYSGGVCCLLDMDGSTRSEFSNQLARLAAQTKVDGRMHDYSLIFTEHANFGITCMIAPTSREVEMNRKLRTYCSMKKYQMKADKWLGIGLVVGKEIKLSAYFYDRNAWTFDNALSEVVAKALPGTDRQAVAQ